jgi:plasmid maintenance system killer protein
MSKYYIVLSDQMVSSVEVEKSNTDGEPNWISMFINEEYLINFTLEDLKVMVSACEDK